uniref:Uncharacterized protein n=1 Tax=Setaria digitata TaxID=48799 RepID=A0A915PTX6_9BILA
MTTLGRRIEPKPPVTDISEAIPLLLVPVARQPAVAVPTQFIPRTIFIDAQSLQANMDSNREEAYTVLCVFIAPIPTSVYRFISVPIQIPHAVRITTDTFRGGLNIKVVG